MHVAMKHTQTQSKLQKHKNMLRLWKPNLRRKFASLPCPCISETVCKVSVDVDVYRSGPEEMPCPNFTLTFIREIIPARDPNCVKTKCNEATYILAPRQSHITFHSPPLPLVLLVGLESYVGPRSICPVSDSFLTRFWPVSDHSMWALFVWALCVNTLCVRTLCARCVSTLCVSSMCEHSMCAHSMWALCVSTTCEHSMCEHSMCEQHVWARCVSTLCVSTTCEHSMCEHSMWPLYASTPCVSSMCEHSICEHSLHEHSICVSTLCVTTLCVSTMCEHSMCEHSICEQHVWARCVRTLCVSTLYVSTLCVSTLCVSTLCVSTPCVSTLCEHYVWAPCVSTLCVSALCEHEHRKVRGFPRKIDISSWAGLLQNTEKFENYHEKSTLPRKIDIRVDLETWTCPLNTPCPPN